MDMHACCCRKRPHNLPPAKCAISIIAQAGLRWRYLPRPPPPTSAPASPHLPQLPSFPKERKQTACGLFLKIRLRHIFFLSLLFISFSKQRMEHGGHYATFAPEQSRRGREERVEQVLTPRRWLFIYLHVCLFAGKYLWIIDATLSPIITLYRHPKRGQRFVSWYLAPTSVWMCYWLQKKKKNPG